MNAQQVVVHGQIRPDGTLHVEEKVDLPPGPVSVTVQPVSAARRRRTLQVLEEIWSERNARGLVGRSKADVDAEIDAMRDEDQERLREIEAMGQRTSNLDQEMLT